MANGKWRVRWYTTDGRHPSRSFSSKAEAESFYASTKTHKAAGLDVPQAPSYRLKDLSDEWWAAWKGSAKPRTVERNLLHVREIEKRLGSVRVRDLDYRRLSRYVADLSCDYAPRTVHNNIGVLWQILDHGQRLGLIDKLPPKPILPKVTKPELTIPTAAEVDRLAEASDARFHSAVLLAAYGGLRQGEILGLARGDIYLDGVDKDEPWIFVRRSRNKTTGAIESTKTERSRRVYLPDRLVAALEAHLDEYPGEPKDLVFPQTASSFQKSWVRAREIAGVHGVRFHDLRHFCASFLIAAGWNVKRIADHLGHADPAITLRTYSHLFPHDVGPALKQLNDHLNRPA